MEGIPGSVNKSVYTVKNTFRNIELGSDPVHIMIVHKRIKPKSFVDSSVFIKLSPDRMSDLKIIVVVMSREESPL